MGDFYINNKQAWADRGLARRYAAAEALHAPEQAILDSLRASLKGRRLLDVGVGGGRTVRHLLGISADYTGIDYSPAMIEQCRARYPDARFEVADIRAPLDRPDRSFDLIFFSYNGIDNLSHDDRLGALREFRRLLPPGGVLVFSSHNRGFVSEIRKPWAFSRLHPEAFGLFSPFRIAKRTPGWLLGLWRCFKNRKYAFAGADHAVVNDGSENYKFLQYYISIPAQIAQLRSCGFEKVKAFAIDGGEIALGQYASCRDPWVNYVCFCGGTA